MNLMAACAEPPDVIWSDDGETYVRWDEEPRIDLVVRKHAELEPVLQALERRYEPSRTFSGEAVFKTGLVRLCGSGFGKSVVAMEYLDYLAGTRRFLQTDQSGFHLWTSRSGPVWDDADRVPHALDPAALPNAWWRFAPDRGSQEISFQRCYFTLPVQSHAVPENWPNDRFGAFAVAVSQTAFLVPPVAAECDAAPPLPPLLPLRPSSLRLTLSEQLRQAYYAALVRVIDAIVAAVLLILAIRLALARPSRAVAFLLVLLAAARRYGRRSEPDDLRTPAHAPRSAKCGELTMVLCA